MPSPRNSLLVFPHSAHHYAALLIKAFKAISGLPVISTTTPDDCSRFQVTALTLPKNWRQRCKHRRKDVPNISVTTVHKWSVALSAAFNRVNRNAGKRCVRGLIDPKKLHSANPWTEFTWAVEVAERLIRQFISDELLGLLDHFDREWAGVTVAGAAAKVFLWSACRRKEVTRLT